MKDEFIIKLTRWRIFLFFATLAISAQSEENGISMDDNFIRASLVIASPGNVLYSCIGHAFIRMECPTHGLDYCFSYESEGVRQKVLKFLSGNLKMEMMAVPTDEFLSQYRNKGRSVMEYNLNLSIPQKQKLWELLDNSIEAGVNLPYDYMERGCAQSCLRIIEDAITPIDTLSFFSWPDYFFMTRRELVRRQMDDYPWNALFLYFLVGTEGDRNVSYKEKVVTPTDLLYVFQHASVNGKPMINGSGTELVAGSGDTTSNSILSPLGCCLILLASLLLCIWRGWIVCEVVLLCFQFILGLFMCYLLFFSSLPCTDWNWLVVPFNPFPLLLWHWRRNWMFSYLVVLIVWLSCILLCPHRIVDRPLLILTAQ